MKKIQLIQLSAALIILLYAQNPSYGQMMANLESLTEETLEKLAETNKEQEMECALSIFCKTQSRSHQKLVRSQTSNSSEKGPGKFRNHMPGLWQLCVENNGGCNWKIKDEVPDNVIGIEEVIMILRMSAGDLPYNFDKYIDQKIANGAQVFKLDNNVISLKLMDRGVKETVIFIDTRRNLLLGINEYDRNNMLTKKLTCDYRQQGRMTTLASASFQNYIVNNHEVSLLETITQFKELSVNREKVKVKMKVSNRSNF